MFGAAGLGVAAPGVAVPAPGQGEDDTHDGWFRSSTACPSSDRGFDIEDTAARQMRDASAVGSAYTECHRTDVNVAPRTLHAQKGPAMRPGTSPALSTALRTSLVLLAGRGSSSQPPAESTSSPAAEGTAGKDTSDSGEQLVTDEATSSAQKDDGGHGPEGRFHICG